MARNKGVKQVSDPGISPGMTGRKPVSSHISETNSDSPYFKVRIKTSYMMNKTITLGLTLILTVFLCSVSNTTKADAALNVGTALNAGATLHAGAAFLNTGNEIKTDTGGRSVSLDSAQLCIARFTAVMKDHGFSNAAGQPVNIHIKKTSMITTGESFSGKNLQDWLNATMTQYASAGKTLVINVQLGIYDDNYLNTYQPNASLRSANKDRIAIFLVPADASTGQPVHALAAQPGNPPPPGGTGFDLGGVQP
jgi:hypothetical protein